MLTKYEKERIKFGNVSLKVFSIVFCSGCNECGKVNDSYNEISSEYPYLVKSNFHELETIGKI